MDHKTKTTEHQQHHRHYVRRRYRWLITAAVLILLIYVLAPQTDALWRSLEIMRQAAGLPVAIAICMMMLTYALSAEIYHMLLKHQIALGIMNLVQAATAMTSRIAPVGIGTMGFNAYFLKRHSHTMSESLAVVAVNNSLGMCGHFLILLVLLTTAPLPAEVVPGISWNVTYWILLAIAVVVTCLALSRRIRHRVTKGLHNLWSAIYSYRHHRRRILGALAMNMLLSTVYVMTLWASAQAIGIYLPFNKVFLIYSFSLLTGAATATPGGLVGVEAGLMAGFIAYGVDADSALAVALLYRLITYWLPLLPGFIAFRVVQHKYL